MESRRVFFVAQLVHLRIFDLRPGFSISRQQPTVDTWRGGVLGKSLESSLKPEQPLYIWWVFKCNSLKIKPLAGDLSFA